MGRIRPILFSTDMVQAVLRDLNPKTVTRRVIKNFIPEDAVWGYTMFTPKDHISCRGTFLDGYGEKFFKLPCQSGDILYVRETWQECEWGYLYRAWPEGLHQPGTYKGMTWRPSIHMPKEAARIWLKVTDVRVERLQDISEMQAQKEGCAGEFIGIGCALNATQIEEFAKLWDTTVESKDCALYGWAANPWVWVIEFERCEKPENWMV